MTENELLARLEGCDAELRKKIEQAAAEKQRSDVDQASLFNVFDFMTPDENRLSNILVELLDLKRSHGQGDRFLRQFMAATEVELREDLHSVQFIREDVTDHIEN